MMNFEHDDYNKPITCSVCGGRMAYRGIGEYVCEDCKFVDYDDFGKVRKYIETHRGANASEIGLATGVKQKTINQMIRDERFDVVNAGKTLLYCEVCGTNIRSGRRCLKCEAARRRL